MAAFSVILAGEGTPRRGLSGGSLAYGFHAHCQDRKVPSVLFLLNAGPEYNPQSLPEVYSCKPNQAAWLAKHLGVLKAVGIALGVPAFAALPSSGRRLLYCWDLDPTRDPRVERGFLPRREGREINAIHQCSLALTADQEIQKSLWRLYPRLTGKILARSTGLDLWSELLDLCEELP